MAEARAEIRVVEAINQALHAAFAADKRRFLIGEDILDPYGGAFKVAKGLSTKYPDRVLTTPISEGAIVGLGAGMALRGLRPIVEIMFGDFMTLAFDQLLNGISKFRSMYNSQVECPIVIRTPMGGRRGYGPTHSQSLDKYLIAVPNVRVVAPSVVHDVEALYHAVFGETGPVIVLENKLMYGEFVKIAQNGQIGNFAVRYSAAPFPTAELSLVEFEQADVTLVCYGGMLSFALAAAEKLFLEEEVSVEIVAPSCLTPVDSAQFAGSLARSGRLLVAEEGTEACGYGAEVITAVSTSLFQDLKAPPMRLAAPNDIIPSSKALEQEFLVGESDIYSSALKLARG